MAGEVLRLTLAVERVLADDLSNSFAILRGELIERYDLGGVRMATSQPRSGPGKRREQDYEQRRGEPTSSAQFQRSAAQRWAHQLLRRRGEAFLRTVGPEAPLPAPCTCHLATLL